MSLLGDLGSVPVEDVTTHKVFNVREVASWHAYTRFAATAKVELNHTYAVLVNDNGRRGLFVFRVIEYVPDQRVRIRYTIKNYEIYAGRTARSPGFDWSK